jgi:type III secretion protein T
VNEFASLDLNNWGQLTEWVRVLLINALLLFSRALGAFALLPVYAAASLPQHLRLAVPVACLPILMAATKGQPLLALDAPVELWLVWALAEFFIGTLLTLPVGILFWAAQSAGELIDIKTGANNNAVFNTGAGTPDGPAQILMVQLAMLTFLASNGLQTVVKAVWGSYQVIPIGGYDNIQLLTLPIIAQDLLGQVFLAVVHIFIPFLIFFLLLEVGIGLAGKLAEQLQVSNIAAPLKSLMFPLLLLILLHNPEFLGFPAALSLESMSSMLSAVAPETEVSVKTPLPAPTPPNSSFPPR